MRPIFQTLLHVPMSDVIVTCTYQHSPTREAMRFRDQKVNLWMTAAELHEWEANLRAYMASHNLSSCGQAASQMSREAIVATSVRKIVASHGEMASHSAHGHAQVGGHDNNAGAKVASHVDNPFRGNDLK